MKEERTAIWLLIVGALLILGAGAWTMHLVGQTATNEIGCDAKAIVAPDIAGSSPVILDVGHAKDAPRRFTITDELCLLVANILPTEQMKELDQQLGDAKTKLASAETDLAKARAAPTAEALSKAEQSLATARDLLGKARTKWSEGTRNIPLTLFVDGRRTLVTVDALGQPGVQPVRFRPKPDADFSSAEAVIWRDIKGGLGRPEDRPVILGIGKADSTLPLAVWNPKDETLGVTMQTFSWPALIACGLGFLLLLAGLFQLGRTTGLLRDGGPDSPYSLARVQMAVWLLLGLFGFLFIWAVTGQYYNVMTSGMLTLMGIAGATGYVAQVLPSPAAGVLPSRKSLLTGPSGELELHRLQLLIWTFVLGAVFVWYVLTELRFAPFDANLLVLVGISSGIYAGLRTREQ